MTVKEVIHVFTEADSFVLTWSGAKSIGLMPDDDFLIDAFGNYKVKSISNGFTPTEYIIELVSRPVKE